MTNNFLLAFARRVQAYVENAQGPCRTAQGNDYFLIPFDGPMGITPGDDFLINGERISLNPISFGDQRVVQDADAVVIRCNRQDGLIIALIGSRVLLNPLLRIVVRRWICGAVDALANKSGDSSGASLVGSSESSGEVANERSAAVEAGRFTLFRPAVTSVFPNFHSGFTSAKRQMLSQKVFT